MTFPHTVAANHPLAVVAATVAAKLVVAHRRTTSFDSMVDVIFNQQAEGFKRDQQAQNRGRNLGKPWRQIRSRFCRPSKKV